MTSIPRALVAAAFLFSSLAGAAHAQSMNGPPRQTHDGRSQQEQPESLQLGDDNWFYEGSDLEQERAWFFGELPNGMRYAVRRNRVPQGQVAFRAVVDTGSIYESEAEQGYAHLLEHLLFRESKYLGKNEAFTTWQRMGAQIGIDANATTSPTQTVFQIDLPNATRKDISETLRLLSGMLEAPVLTDANVKEEIPIVLAEKRDSDSAQRRVGDRQREVFYTGQPLGERAPIGTQETLEAATGASLSAFHKRWYRPDNVVMVVVGDIDPLTVARMIEEHYSEWQAEGEKTPAPSFGDPVVPADAVPTAGLMPPLGETELMIEPDLSPMLSYAVLRPWRPVLDTKDYNRGLMRTAVAQSILNRRLEARARKGAYLYAVVEQADVYRSVDATFISVGPLEGDWQGALGAVRGIIEDAILTPPTQAEIDREVESFQVGYQDYFDKRNLRQSSEIAQDVVGALDIRETSTSPGAVLRLFASAKPTFTSERIHEAMRGLFEGTVTRGLLVADRPGLGDETELAVALTKEVAPDTSSRVESGAIDVAALPPVGTPTEAKVEYTGLFDLDRLEWDNGVSALVWPTRQEPGRITVKVRFGSGLLAFAPDEVPYAKMGELALIETGQAGLDNEALDRLANSRKVAFDFTIDDGRFVFSAETRAEDLADQLYIFAAKFAHPRWDTGPMKRSRAAGIQGYRSYATSPGGVLERDLEFLLRGRDPRFRSPTSEEFEATTDAGFQEVWSRILAAGPLEVQVFGDFNRADAIKALNETFGAMPARAALSSAKGAKTLTLTDAGQPPITVTHRGSPDQAMAVVAFNTGGGIKDFPTSRKLELVSMLYSNRLLDNLRERLGASYAPQMVSQWPIALDNGGRLLALAQVKPEDVPAIFEEIDRISRDLVANGPTDEEMATVSAPLRQMVRRSNTGSGFYMWQLEDATFDPARFKQIDTMYEDYTEVTARDVQELAKRFLRPENAIRIQIMPEGGQ